jgi:thiol-disulfide isomerase/thioredoxin
MDPVGIGVVALVLLAGVGGGAWWKWSNGRLRDIAPSVDSGGKLSDRAGLLIPSQDGVGAAEDAGDARDTEPGVDEHVDPSTLTALGVRTGERATLLQFSSAYCAPCRAVSRLSSEIADEIPGVRHIEVDAETHLDEVRTLGIWRTPTLLLLDSEGRIRKRATGVPKKPQLIAAVRETL